VHAPKMRKHAAGLRSWRLEARLMRRIRDPRGKQRTKFGVSIQRRRIDDTVCATFWHKCRQNGAVVVFFAGFAAYWIGRIGAYLRAFKKGVQHGHTRGLFKEFSATVTRDSRGTILKRRDWTRSFRDAAWSASPSATKTWKPSATRTWSRGSAWTHESTFDGRWPTRARLPFGGPWTGLPTGRPRTGLSTVHSNRAHGIGSFAAIGERPPLVSTGIGFQFCNQLIVGLADPSHERLKIAPGA
jgi:hypothetical protein